MPGSCAKSGALSREVAQRLEPKLRAALFQSNQRLVRVSLMPLLGSGISSRAGTEAVDNRPQLLACGRI